MTYEEYKEARKGQIRHLVNSKLMHLRNSSTTEDILEDSLSEYETKVSRKIHELYKEANLSPEPYEFESFITKIKNPKLKHSILTHCFNLDLLYEAIHEMIQYKEPERKHPTLEECLEKIPKEKRQEAISILQKYIEEYGEKPQYIGSGESCTVFQIGNKVVKFGSKRRYTQIPFCLEIHEQFEYAPHQCMYVTDKIKTGNISSIETEAMYRALRDEGYIWVDVKPDNIGTQNEQLKILDDVDIYTEQDALSQHRKSTILEFVSYNMDLAILELKWLQSKSPHFSINNIDSYFPNQSNHTKEKIDRIKDTYIRQTKSYTFDPSKMYYQSFGLILEAKISEQNSASTTDTISYGGSSL